MIVHKYVNLDKPMAPLTQEQIDQLNQAAAAPIQYDPENPPLTQEELSQFRRISDHNGVPVKA